MVGLNAARLILPKVYARMHLVSHVSLLRKYEARNGFKPLSPPLEVLDDDSVYEVDEVLAHRVVCNVHTHRHFLLDVMSICGCSLGMVNFCQDCPLSHFCQYTCQWHILSLIAMVRGCQTRLPFFTPSI